MATNFEIIFVLTSFLMIVTCGCSTLNPTVPSGTYEPKFATGDFIEIIGDQIHIHIAGADRRDEERKGITFKYALWSDGRLFPLVERSAEMLHGYPSLDFHWDGEKITVANPKLQSKWEFFRK